ncbi:competence protein ComE [Anabaena sp. FACHB-1237]|uniref:phospholipase D-like domain-containing protein n=1 Tax=Anabaena sp. FACHB-1237 TaxID=2692769 RepID=UPI0016807E7E|nr:phospholipase D-like domain-containing protein [Anabaena sp. FACHB-1237]MBD2138812.1 competence protein ComE [Anabaena sp. FACHB-1237]
MQKIHNFYYFTYIFLLILSLIGCQQVQSSNQLSNQTLPPLPQDELIKVYFNNSQTSSYQENYRQKTRLGDDLEKQIIDTISTAKSTIDIAVQELRLPKIAQTLAKKQQEGVKIRLILENNYSRPWSSLTPQEIAKLQTREQEKYQEFIKFADINQDGKLTNNEINEKDAIAIIKNAQIPWIDDTEDGSKGSSLMHHKFTIVDNQFVIITSANFTFSDTSGDISNNQSLGNANNLLKIDSPELAKLFTQEFNIMWGDGVGKQKDSKFGLQKPIREPQKITLGNSQITVNFSPISPTQTWEKSSNGLIGKTLNTATKNIDIALFIFSEQKLANILEKKHDQKVDIKALIEPQFAYRDYSDILDMMGLALSNKCQYQIDNKPWKNPLTTVGVPILPQGDLLHHKFAVIDNKTVITGSHNWSAAGNNNNDETLIIIENPVIAAHYQQEFNRLYQKARIGLPARIKSKIDAEEKSCPQIKKVIS